jgi:hypothetical protein
MSELLEVIIAAGDIETASFCVVAPGHTDARQSKK